MNLKDGEKCYNVQQATTKIIRSNAMIAEGLPVCHRTKDKLGTSPGKPPEMRVGNGIIPIGSFIVRGANDGLDALDGEE